MTKEWHAERPMNPGGTVHSKPSRIELSAGNECGSAPLCAGIRQPAPKRVNPGSQTRTPRRRLRYFFASTRNSHSTDRPHKVQPQLSRSKLALAPPIRNAQTIADGGAAYDQSLSSKARGEMCPVCADYRWNVIPRNLKPQAGEVATTHVLLRTVGQDSAVYWVSQPGPSWRKHVYRVPALWLGERIRT